MKHSGGFRLNFWIIAWSLPLCVGTLGQVPGQSPDSKSQKSFELNQQVEAREGDSWSHATIVAKEGRKLQIRYSDGTLEWVAMDRVRTLGPKPAGVATTNPATKPAGKEQYAVNAAVEVKDAGMWNKAVVKNRDGNLYLVALDAWKDQFFWKWVHVGVRGTAGGLCCKSSEDGICSG